MRQILLINIVLLLNACSLSLKAQTANDTSHAGHSILRIECNAHTGGEGYDFPNFDMSINQDLKGIYNPWPFVKPKRVMTRIVDSASYAHLLLLINEADFEKLNDKYSIGATDRPDCKVKVIYADGKVKLVEDYGLKGPDKLRAIYNYILSLRDSQAWK